MKNVNLDYSLIEQIDKHRQEAAEAEWCAKVDRAKASGSLQARIQAAAIVIALMMALILIPEPIKRWW